MRAEVVVSILLGMAASTAVAYQDSCSDWASGWDMPTSHGLLNDGTKTITYSEESCCKKCNENPVCHSWTRIKETRGDHKKGECWLRDSIPDAKPCDYCSLGVKVNYKDSDDCRSSVYANFDMPGGDLIHTTPRATRSHKHCCTLCNNTPGCRTWTYIRFTVPDGNKRGDCWMRRDEPNWKECSYCISGVSWKT